MTRFIKQLKYNDRTQFHDSRLYEMAKIAVQMIKEGKTEGKEKLREVAEMVTREKNWYDKMQCFVVRKPGGVDHMRLGIMNVKLRKYFVLDPMQGVASYKEFATTDEQGYAQQEEVITRLGEEITKNTGKPIRKTEWEIGRAQGAQQTVSCH